MNYLKLLDKNSFVKKYILKEMMTALTQVKYSNPDFINKYKIDFDYSLSAFVINIKGTMTKEMKQGIHKKFKNLLEYRGVSFPYIFIYKEKK